MKRTKTNTDETAVAKVVKKHFKDDKKERVVKWAVTPYMVTHGKITAPSIYVDAKKKEEAIKAAKSRTRLSDFPSWFFDAVAISE